MRLVLAVANNLNQNQSQVGGHNLFFFFLFIKELRKKVRCEALPNILSISSNEFYKFNNTGARMQDSI